MDPADEWRAAVEAGRRVRAGGARGRATAGAPVKAARIALLILWVAGSLVCGLAAYRTTDSTSLAMLSGMLGFIGAFLVSFLLGALAHRRRLREFYAAPPFPIAMGFERGTPAPDATVRVTVQLAHGGGAGNDELVVALLWVAEQATVASATADTVVILMRPAWRFDQLMWEFVRPLHAVHPVASVHADVVTAAS